MTSERHGPFEQLEPPAGGAEQLRKRLEAAALERRGPRRALAVSASAAVLAALAAVAVFLDAQRNTERVPDWEHDQAVASLYAAPQFDRLLGRPLERAEPSVRLNDRPAKVAEIRTESENVRLYRLE